MTATSVSSSEPIARRSGASVALAGTRPLFRKDVGEWRHGVRLWVVLIVTSAFMALAAANSAINQWVVANVAEAQGQDARISLVPLDNVVIAVSSQVFIFAAIFAAMSLLVGERDRGTLSWIASKPVSRTSIWLSKFSSATAMLWVAAAIVPMVITAAVATVLYGVPSIPALIVITLGMGATIALFVAVVLAGSTLVASQPAVAAIGFAVLFLPALLGGILPSTVLQFLPTSILSWAVGLAGGADVGYVAPVAWLAWMIGIGVFSARQMGRLEL
ncbi:MAG: ABC transporter permease [Chloroflexota bacterium]